VDNLCDLIQTCLVHPGAVNETFLVSDGRDLSTTELLRLAGDAMGHPARLWPFPSSWLHFAAAMVGKPGFARRLCGNLQVDIEKTKSLLGWAPPVSVEAGLRRIFENSGNR
jgi:nucleoside-diphosphate-sugar epimerase